MARFTRRELAIALAASPLIAQQAPPVKKNEPSAAPQTVQQAVENVRQAGDKLRSLAVPMTLEPAFTFKA
jgi:hypothetical protein